MRIQKPEIISRRQILLLAVILLAGGFLRMGQPGLVEFKRDEAQLYSLALDMAEFQQFHVRGISSSIGFPNFPMNVWLYALPLLLWKHVYAAVLFTGLVNALAVLGCWWLTRRYWGATAAFAAAVLFAASPWAVFHSQKIWAQNLLPPLVIGWAIGAALAFGERRPAFIFLHLLCLAVAVQVHLAGIALLPATLIFLIVFRERVIWRYVWAAGGIALLTAVPFLVYLLSNSPISPTLGAVSGGGRGFDLLAWRYTWLLISGQEIHALAGPERFTDYLAGLPGIPFIHLLWGILGLAGLVWLGSKLWPKKPPTGPGWEIAFIVVVWFLAPPLFFSLPLLPVELHYLLPVYPVPYIAAGVLFAALLERLPRWRATGWGLLVFSAVIQGWAWLSLLGLVGTQATPGGYGTPVQFHLRAAEEARQLLALEEEGGEILLAGQSETPGEDEFAAVYHVLLRDVPHRFVDTTRSALFPAGSAVVLLNQEAAGPAVEAYLMAAGRVRRLPLREGEGILQVATLPAESAPLPEVTLPEPALFANWITIIGYDPPEMKESQEMLWQFYWYPGANPDPADYHFFNHLLDADGQRIAQADSAAFAPWQWRPGDTVLSFFLLPWPQETAGPLTIRTGLYTYPALENVPLLDVAGNPTSDAVEFVVEGERP